MDFLARFQNSMSAGVKSWLGIVREWWRPLLTGVLLCAAVLLISPTDSIDRRISDQLLVSQSLAGDASILIVEIDSADVRRYGGPPLSRDGMAKLLDHLAEYNVKRVLLDAHLGEPLFTESDQFLARSMARLGPTRLGLVSGPTPTALPYALFAKNATIVDSRLTPDSDGWHRQIGWTGVRRGNNPAIWLATGRTDRKTANLDLRISPFKFDRMSARAMIESSQDLSGRLVLISYSPDVAPSRALLPMTTDANRGTVIAVGVQSVKQGYAQLHRRGELANMAIQLAAILIALLCGLAARSGRMLVATMVASMAVLFAACVGLAQHFAVEIYPIRTLSCFMVMSNVTLAQRLKLIPMMASFLRGDMSPEEAWIWRGYEKANGPVVLFSASGRIKRSNAAAAAVMEGAGERLAQQSLPRLGERAAEVMVTHGDGTVHSYELDWPYADVPLAVLRDTTETEAVRRALQEQLLTDELTGKANRRGFEYALNTATNKHAAFGVFFIDMNGFKTINDTYGHDAGDEVLMISASRLANLIRPEDTVARLGGDEFAVLVTGLDDEARAELLTQRMVDALLAPAWLTATGCEVRVGAAVGFALRGDDRIDPAELLNRADKAMYRHKLASKQRAMRLA